jgi:hypothetical protein
MNSISEQCHCCFHVQQRTAANSCAIIGGAAEFLANGFHQAAWWDSRAADIATVAPSRDCTNAFSANHRLVLGGHMSKCDVEVAN